MIKGITIGNAANTIDQTSLIYTLYGAGDATIVAVANLAPT